MHYFSNELCWFSISRKHTRSWQTHFSNFLCTDLHKHKLLQTNKLKEKKTSKPSLPLKFWNLIWRARNIFFTIILSLFTSVTKDRHWRIQMINICTSSKFQLPQASICHLEICKTDGEHHACLANQSALQCIKNNCTSSKFQLSSNNFHHEIKQRGITMRA